MTLPLPDATLTEAPSLPPDQPFSFRNARDQVRGQVCATGPVRPLDRAGADTLADRVAPFFGAARDADDDGALIGGALPFDKARPDCLWQVAGGHGAWPGANAGGPARSVPEQRPTRPCPQPPATGYMDSVARALEIMRAERGLPDALTKVVLARSLLVEDRMAFALPGLMARLAEDPAVTVFQVALPQDADGSAPRQLVGATPELLLRKRGDSVVSHPLAGSARRLDDPEADARNANALARSEKDRREHGLVVEYILDMLAPVCKRLGTPEGTALTTTRSMWHIGTRIEGRLKDPETPAILLAAALHPTPAVCGLPCDRAARLIRDLEPVARDFYAGAVGWCDRRGDGDWHVAIRCAELCGARARLFAGAGIVLGSDPRAEASETGAKFGAFLSALGLPPDAALSDPSLHNQPNG
ncbi:isochorismate synthase [Rhodovulum viride]|uniref:isochorismate synthase n=1 Tax=Rhodovulum viride TaxID=1231134 RepID=UPI001FE41942|nr:isochorismate synthase [Rhodovulum viride]